MSKGIIYFIQPAEIVGTNRYKIGCSKNPDLNRCNKGYKKSTRFICIMECNNPFELERKIKDTFKNKFKLFCGNEYFCGDEKNMLKEFIEIIFLHEKLTNLDNSDILNIKAEQHNCKILNNLDDYNIKTDQNNCNILVSNNNKIIVNKEFKCNICNKEYKSYQTLWNHNKIKHILKNNKFSCELCNKKFTRKDNLKYHINNTCNINFMKNIFLAEL
jgi:hypothetical protein